MTVRDSIGKNLKKKATVLATILALGLSLGACGAQNGSAQGAEGQQKASQSSGTNSQKKVRTYTDEDVENTKAECSKFNHPGGDLIDTVADTKNVLDYTSLGGVMSEGLESDVFQCVVKHLDIPHDVVKEINMKSDAAQTDTVGNLNIKWTHEDDGLIGIYMSTHSLDQ